MSDALPNLRQTPDSVSVDSVEAGHWPINRLPASWCWASFHDLISDETSSRKKILEKNYLLKGRIPVVDQGNSLIGGFTDDESMLCCSLPPVIVWGDHTQVVKFINFRFAQGADGVKVLKPRVVCDAKFVYYSLLLVEIPKKGYSRHFKFLRSTRFPLPPLAEQKRIVAKIEALMARITRARAEIDRSRSLAIALKKSVVALIDTVPCASPAKFADIFDYKGGSQPPKSDFHNFAENGLIRLLQIRDFTSDSKAVYIKDNGKWPRCKSHDIMIGRYGASVGKILTGKEGAYNVALVKMIFDDQRVQRRFLYHWLCGETFQGRLREISRSAQDGFNKDDLAELCFPLVSYNMQLRIAERIDSELARVERVEKEAQRAFLLLDHLESSILRMAFRGELVRQDPNDEPASVLLERIRVENSQKPKRPVCDSKQAMRYFA